MLRSFFSIFSFIMLLSSGIFSFYTASLTSAELSHHVLVSVAPYKYFINKIAGETVSVDLMVPAGASAHTFEPTPKQMIQAGQADIWFLIGESFESKASRALTINKPSLRLIDLKTGVDMITADPHSGACCCHANSQDLHVWLSCRQALIQAETILNTLSGVYPEHSKRYQEGFDALKKELEDVDKQITTLLAPITNRLMMVFHPAYAYFCRDYQFKQLPIEIEGKDPTPKQLHQILNQARLAHVKKIFVQPQYSTKGAQLFARELGAKVVILDPYSENYSTTLVGIAKAIAEE